MNVLRFTRYTNTTKFILPLLFDNDTTYHELFSNFFINAYIADMANKINDDKIHLLFADYPSLSIQQKLPDPVTEYQYKDGFVLVCPFSIEWEEDYNKLITGQYSTISEKAKKQILSFWEEDNTSLLWGVLYKQGNAVREYFEKVLGTKIYQQWTHTKEWWLDFIIPDEILGLTKS
jgi:hypothetical protein